MKLSQVCIKNTKVMHVAWTPHIQTNKCGVDWLHKIDELIFGTNVGKTGEKQTSSWKHLFPLAVVYWAYTVKGDF